MVCHIGAEPFMTSMLFRLELDMAMTMSALNCLKLEPNLRKRIAESLVPSSKMKVYIFSLIYHPSAYFVPEGYVIYYSYRQ